MDEVLAERVRLTCDGPVASLTLVRPEAGNALDLLTARALRDAVRKVHELPQLRALRLDAVGSAFCVGGDLAEFAGVPDVTAHVAAVAAAAHDAIAGLRDLPVPVVTVVQGVAAGGGFGLALSGDLAVVARSARFKAAYTAVGLSPDCGLSHHLTRRVGHARALDLLMTNRVLSADEALSWGVVARVVEDGELAAAADDLVDLVAASSTAALLASRRLVRSAVDTGFRDQLKAEADSIAALAGSPDGQEGVRAFREKRRPRFAPEA